ncbi:type ISP restriction/modification enzyme, partial [Parvibaculum sp.]|uniref:type ISP restriction/modification enzyme n=1 Tax=Parvibaculum sp. TaxID=2024848 RepID=UPI003437A898
SPTSASSHDVSQGHEIIAAFMIQALRSRGVTTSRDAWCYNSSSSALLKNVETTINFYNSELARWEAFGSEANALEDFVRVDLTQISWGGDILKHLSRGEALSVDPTRVVQSVYRPFFKSWLYFDRILNNRIYQMPKMFPSAEASNRVIMVSGVGAKTFTPFMVDAIPCLDLIEKGQCYPLTVYDDDGSSSASLFDEGQGGGEGTGRHGVSDAGLAYFSNAYPREKISKDDIFYYVYGLLHSTEYRSLYGDSLSKELPRIPCVKQAEDFWRFTEAGRALADLHVNYECADPWPVTIKEGDLRLADIKNPKTFYRVTKMKFAKSGKEVDKTTVVYNANITMQDIPLEAYDYVVNDRSALEWVMERQAVKTDKASGIVNDANRYAIEGMDNPAYPLELFQRVITVSMETLKIVRGLPALDI